MPRCLGQRDRRIERTAGGLEVLGDWPVHDGRWWRGEHRSVRLDVLRMTKPVTSSHAEMLEGSPEEIATKIADLLAARGLL